MIDQQEKFTNRGIVAEFVGEAQEYVRVVRRVLKGELQLQWLEDTFVKYLDDWEDSIQNKLMFYHPKLYCNDVLYCIIDVLY